MAVPIVLALLQEEERQTYETTLQVDEMEVADEAQNVIHSLKAAAIIQRFLRIRLNPTRLHHRNLTDRLIFEGKFMIGLFRLTLQILLFVFLILGSSMSSTNADAAGIYSEIVQSFDLQSLTDVKSTQEFLFDYLPRVTKRSREFSPLSNNYFLTGPEGGVNLLGEWQVFAQSQRLNSININVRTPAFTFTAWVKTSSQFVDGYILRKRVGSSGISEGVSCWAWSLGKFSGPRFHYGGHDYFPPPELSPLFTKSTSANDRQIKIAPQKKSAIKANTPIFLAIVVEHSDEVDASSGFGTVSFFRDAKLIDTLALPRRFTDCFNGLEGVCVRGCVCTYTVYTRIDL